VLTGVRLALWWRDRRWLAELAPVVARLDPKLRETRIAASLMGIGLTGVLSESDRLRLAGAFPSGSSTGQRLASFNAQIRAEVHLVCGEPEAAMDAIRDADANGFIDRTWIERCPLLEPLRGSRDLDAIRRSTTLRASRVSDILDGK
jgi:serine/threonine-protein kinase